MAGWDVLKPADTDLVRNYPTLARQDKLTLRTQLQVEHDVLDGPGTATGRHKFPIGITAERPVNPAPGSLFFNTELWDTEMWSGASWFGVPGTVPCSMVWPWAANITVPVPAGWLECNGQEVSRTTYARLFSFIGIQYGGGDNVTTFNVPNLKGRVPVGYDPGDTSFDTIGELGGEKLHALAAVNMPIHTHVVNDPTHNHAVADPTHNHTLNNPAHGHVVTDPSHNHSIADPTHVHGVTDPTHLHSMELAVGGADSGNPNALITDGQKAVSRSAATGMINGVATGVSVNGAATGIGVNGAATGLTVDNGTTTVSANAVATGISVLGSGTGISLQNAGEGGAHNNMQPYAVMRYIIKY